MRKGTRTDSYFQMSVSISLTGSALWPCANYEDTGYRLLPPLFLTLVLEVFGDELEGGEEWEVGRLRDVMGDVGACTCGGSSSICSAEAGLPACSVGVCWVAGGCGGWAGLGGGGGAAYISLIWLWHQRGRASGWRVVPSVRWFLCDCEGGIGSRVFSGQRGVALIRVVWAGLLVLPVWTPLIEIFDHLMFGRAMKRFLRQIRGWWLWRFL